MHADMPATQAKAVPPAVQKVQESSEIVTKRGLIEVNYDLLKWFIGLFLTNFAF